MGLSYGFRQTSVWLLYHWRLIYLFYIEISYFPKYNYGYCANRTARSNSVGIKYFKAWLMVYALLRLTLSTRPRIHVFLVILLQNTNYFLFSYFVL